jgi:hypothetical protein
MMRIVEKVDIIVSGYLKTTNNRKGGSFWEEFLKEIWRKVREVCEW